MDASNHSAIIKSLAHAAGFSFCGISTAGFLEKEASRLEAWLAKGYQGEMKYLENYFDLRLDPRKLVPGTKTVVSLMYNYYPSETINQDSYKIAKYAYGEDYHKVVKEKCRELMEKIRERLGDVQGRAFVDSAPVMERAWAEKAGLGWVGRHGLLINKQAGSFFFLAELMIDLACEPDSPANDHCGTCTRCVDACPTNAILPDKTLNATQCISYLTIELKSQVPQEFSGKMEDWIFGCDICQDVCPWNRFSKANDEKQFTPKEALKELDRRDWEDISEEVFGKLFSKSAVKRTGYKGLKRNIEFVSGKTSNDRS